MFITLLIIFVTKPGTRERLDLSKFFVYLQYNIIKLRLTSILKCFTD